MEDFGFVRLVGATKDYQITPNSRNRIPCANPFSLRMGFVFTFVKLEFVILT